MAKLSLVDEAPEDLDLADLTESYLLSCEDPTRGRVLSKTTLRNYRDGLRLFHRWLVEEGRTTVVAEITDDDVRAWITHLAKTRSDATARARYVTLQLFFGWLVKEGVERGGLAESPMARMRPPAVKERPVPVPKVDDLRAILKATAADKSFEGIRDLAAIRLMADVGLRLSELRHLRLGDLDGDVLTILHGKGDKDRRCQVGIAARRALDTYLRVRRRHPLARFDRRDVHRPTWGPLSLGCGADRHEEVSGGRYRAYPPPPTATFFCRCFLPPGHVRDLDDVALRLEHADHAAAVRQRESGGSGDRGASAAPPGRSPLTLSVVCYGIATFFGIALSAGLFPFAFAIEAGT